MAVTKNFSYKAINSAIANNIFLIGENKVQETEKKITQIINREKIMIHFIVMSADFVCMVVHQI